ncbi:hypothetical protein J1N35_023070, partial [Gossypium stocksii]
MPRSIRFFIWLAFLDRLNRNEICARKQMTVNATCQLCERVEESVKHIVRSCAIGKEIWVRIRAKNRQQNLFQPLQRLAHAKL